MVIPIYTPFGQWSADEGHQETAGLAGRARAGRDFGTLEGGHPSCAAGRPATRDGPQRTCDLEKRIAGISQKVLIEQLRALEEHGVVSRQPSAGDSQGIEYLLTPLGESLRPVLDSLIEWGAHHAKELDEVHRLLPCDAVVRDRTT